MSTLAPYDTNDATLAAQSRSARKSAKSGEWHKAASLYLSELARGSHAHNCLSTEKPLNSSGDRDMFWPSTSYLIYALDTLSTKTMFSSSSCMCSILVRRKRSLGYETRISGTSDRPGPNTKGLHQHLHLSCNQLQNVCHTWVHLP